MNESRIAVYYATPLCKKCKKELSKVQRISVQEKIDLRVEHSIWKRIKYGIQLMNMPIVVINGKSFSVLGAFKEEALVAELKQYQKPP
ncbi:MAG: hypothetical protein HY929_04415 [Euryarchaeota archaeon]|nr:hypothetical protein [Euryarchaeota archaeon]